MSFQNAYDQIVATLEALDGLHHCTDVNALAKGDIERANGEAGNAEGAFLLKMAEWEPYPEVNNNQARDYTYTMELQIRAMVDSSNQLEKAKGRIAGYMHKAFKALVIADASSVGADVCAILPIEGEKARGEHANEGTQLMIRWRFKLIATEV